MGANARFDITRLQLRHYRSIKSVDLRPGPLSILVGPNGSGKSNIVDSLRIVSQALNENLDNALRQRGGVSEVRRRSNGHPTHFTIRIDGQLADLFLEYSFSVGATKDRGYAVTDESCRVRPQEFGADDSHFEIKGGEFVSSSLDLTPRIHNDRLALVAFSGQPPFNRVFEALAGMEVFSPSPEAMRAAQTPDTGEFLKRDASNIASVLWNLEQNDPETKRQIEMYLGRIVPGVESVSRKPANNWETLEFKQRVGAATAPWNFPATSVSDGTLRALAILTAMLYVPNEKISSPIVIEEPETALHPAAAGVLLDAIRDASERRQIMVTSHSPDLLDSESIGTDQLFAVRSVKGTTVAERPDETAAFALKEGLFSAGELLRSDQLHPQGDYRQAKLAI